MPDQFWSLDATLDVTLFEDGPIGMGGVENRSFVFSSRDGGEPVNLMASATTANGAPFALQNDGVRVKFFGSLPDASRLIVSGAQFTLWMGRDIGTAIVR